METIELKLDPETLKRAKKLAEMRQYTLEAFLGEIIENLGSISSEKDPLLGMFADEPELMDQIVESTLQAREVDPLRQAHE